MSIWSFILCLIIFHYIHCNLAWQGQIRRLKQSMLRPLFIKGICRGDKTKPVNQDTVLLPMVSISTVNLKNRFQYWKNGDRAVSSLTIWWEGRARSSSEDGDDAPSSDKLPCCHCQHGDLRGCVSLWSLLWMPVVGQCRMVGGTCKGAENWVPYFL